MNASKIITCVFTMSCRQLRINRLQFKLDIQICNPKVYSPYSALYVCEQTILVHLFNHIFDYQHKYDFIKFTKMWIDKDGCYCCSFNNGYNTYVYKCVLEEIKSDE